MCRSCGSIIGAGQKECAVCGAAVTSRAGTRTSRPVADNETLRFARAVLERPYKFTIILLVANIFVFLLMWQSSGPPFSLLTPITHHVLIPFGAKVNFYIQARHEWWRFITPMFLHINLLHLLVNMYSLWIVGPYVEKLYGSAKFVVFWVLTGIAGFVASYLTVRQGVSIGPVARFIFKPLDNPAGGASGALFGLVGVLFVFGIKFRHELPEGFKRAFGTGLLPMILLNLFIGYVGRGFIDNAAHLGGLVSGAVLALAVDYRRPGERSGTAITWRVLQAAAIVLVAVSFLKTAQHFRDPMPPTVIRQMEESVDPNAQKFVSWAKAMNAGQDAFYLALKEGDVTNADSVVKELETAPSLDPKADELRERLKALMVKAKDLKAPMVNSNQPSTRESSLRAQELAKEFDLWSREYNAWLKNIGRSYGLVEVSETPPSK